MTFIEAYHVGFAVADLDATMTEFSELLGVDWAAPQQRDLPVRTRQGEIRARFRFTYSTPMSGQALIELIEGPPDTPWDPGDDAARFHHVGFWDDELAATVARLDAAGASYDAGMVDEDGAPVGFAYHQLSHGPRVELVDASRRANFQAWLAGGRFPQAGEGGQ